MRRVMRDNILRFRKKKPYMAFIQVFPFKNAGDGFICGIDVFYRW